MSGFSFGAPAAGTTGGFSLSTPSTQTSQPAQTSGFSFGSVATKPLAAAVTSTPAQGSGFSFGMGAAATSSTPAAGTSGFSFSTPAASSQQQTSGALNFSTKPAGTTGGGLNFGITPGATSTGVQQQQPSTTSATGGFNFSSGGTATPLNLAGSTAAPATSAPPPVFNFKAPTASATSTALVPPSTTTQAANPLLAGSLTSNTSANTATSTPLLSGFLASSTSTVTTSSGGIGGFSFAASTAASTSSTVTSLSTATTTSSLIGSTPSTESMTVRQLEEKLNKWHLEAKEMEERFRRQAQHVNQWDTVLQKGHTQVHSLRKMIDTVQSDQDRLEAELDFIKGQQSELESLLSPLEASVGENPNSSVLGSNTVNLLGDKQRDNMYHLAQNLDGQLRQMSDDLAKVIEHVNTVNGSSEKSSDSVVMVAKILSAHMDTLKWIDESSTGLITKMDEMSKNIL